MQPLTCLFSVPLVVLVPPGQLSFSFSFCLCCQPSLPQRLVTQSFRFSSFRVINLPCVLFLMISQSNLLPSCWRTSLIHKPLTLTIQTVLTRPNRIAIGKIPKRKPTADGSIRSVFHQQLQIRGADRSTQELRSTVTFRNSGWRSSSMPLTILQDT